VRNFQFLPETNKIRDRLISEQEILLIPDSKFKIIGVKNDNRTVIMQELLPDAETEFDLCQAYDHDPDDIDPDMIEPGLFD
jgi:hypothetical protein